jgi:hypothetical protein
MPKPKVSRPRKSKDPLSGLRRRADVPVRQHGLDLAVYDPAAERVHILNPVAAALWNQLTPDRTFQQVQEMLALAFTDTTSAQIGRDLKAVIRKLHGLNLLVSPSRHKPKRGGKHAAVTIPGTTISSLDHGYKKPAVKTYTVPQLDRAVQKATKLHMFCDLLVRPYTKGGPIA